MIDFRKNIETVLISTTAVLASAVIVFNKPFSADLFSLAWKAAAVAVFVTVVLRQYVFKKF